MNLEYVFSKFIKNEMLVSCEKYGNGHINVTYLAVTENGKKYILQKINSNIFKNVDLLMNNIGEVTTYLKKDGTLTIFMLNSDSGKNYAIVDNCYYRLYEFVDNSITYEKADSLEMVEDAAKSFGWFHNKLAGLDSSKLGETIPQFHDTKNRYSNFLNSVKLNKSGKIDSCRKEIEDVKNFAKYYPMIVKGIEEGKVALHVTHNDPKINNVLFDVHNQSFKCVIDLDTVMPGPVLYDFGDALRSLMTGDKEDSKDYSSVVCNFDIYKHYLKAYYSEAKHFLSDREIELLPYAPFLMTMECGMRFLTDHLDGDVYFATHRENQNLDRARTQIHLAKSIMQNIDELKKITKEICNQ